MTMLTEDDLSDTTARTSASDEGLDGCELGSGVVSLAGGREMVEIKDIRGEGEVR
jgi:hypothetical protein